MRNILASLLVMGLFASVSANACDAGDLCRDKAAVFTDALNFSHDRSQSGDCPILSDTQALQIARLVVSDQMSYRGFKKVYVSTCNYNDAIAAASSHGQADVVADVIAFSHDRSQSGDCPVLSDAQALDIARLVSSHEISLADFKTVYRTTCNYGDSVQISLTPGKANLVANLINYSHDRSQSGDCGVLSDSQASEVASRVLNGTVDLGDFKMSYRASCNYGVSLEAARCIGH